MKGRVGRGKQQNGSVISRGTLGELVPHDQCLYAKEAFTREHWTLNLESGRMRAVKTVSVPIDRTLVRGGRHGRGGGGAP